ncbi:ALG10 [Scenedesmus sp. PABB004]|nr:ALG10 [Scenedesmus sp. PABB004]
MAPRRRAPPPRGQQQPVAWLPASVTLAALTAALGVTLFVGAHVPEPYMDEPFHVPMAQRYCAGRLREWDPKVTTFPGLYVLGAAYAWASAAALGWATGAGLELTCSGPFLRSLNALLWVATLQLAYATSRELQRGGGGGGGGGAGAGRARAPPEAAQAARAAGVAAVVALLPSHAFFAFLFYTDVPSLLFVLLTALLLARRAPWAAAGAGAAAVAMRQTNAVWVAFLAGAAALRDVLPAARRRGGGGAPPCGAARELAALVAAAWAARARLGADYAPLLALCAAFGAFVVVNRGVTVGDRDAHAPVLHLMQPLYCALFTAAAAAPLLPAAALARAGAAAAAASPARAAAAAAATVALTAGVAARYSLAHPYLLADNRHYTFYLWRRLLDRGPAARLALAPAYAAAAAALGAGLAAAQHWLWVAGFAAATVATLAPAWLLELRYFTAPFALAVLHLPPPPPRAAAAVAAAFLAVNAATLWVFARRPFTWGDGSVARFMCMDWVALVGGLLIGYLLFAIWRAWRDARAPPPPPAKWEIGDITGATLAGHNGYDWSKPTLLAVRGVVYDVSTRNDLYGPGKPLNVYAGRECARALAKDSAAADDCSADLSGCSDAELARLEEQARRIAAEFDEVGKVVPMRDVTPEELAAHDGSDPGRPMLISIRGVVFDVSSGKQFYGPDGIYPFAGREVARAFALISTDLKDCTDDLSGLGAMELDALRDWEAKFNSKYPIVGRLVQAGTKAEAKAGGKAAGAMSESWVVRVTSADKLPKVAAAYRRNGFKVVHSRARPMPHLVVLPPAGGGAGGGAVAAAAGQTSSAALAWVPGAPWPGYFAQLSPGGDDPPAGARGAAPSGAPRRAADLVRPTFVAPPPAGARAAAAAAADAAVAAALRGVDGVIDAERSQPMYLLRDPPHPPGLAARRRGLRGAAPAASCPVPTSGNPDIAAGTGTVSEGAPYGVRMLQADHPDVIALSRNFKQKVLFCVIDTGLDRTNPEFDPATTSGCSPGVPHSDGTPAQCTNEWSADQNGHGTHTSGTIAARRDGRGIVGVSAEGAQLYHYNIFGSAASFGDVDFIAAWDACETELDARRAASGVADMRLVISMSIGGGGQTAAVSQALALLAARRSDVLLVAAAGNGNSSALSYPAAAPEVVSVASVDWDGRRSWFSQYNADVEWAAPGTGVLSTFPMSMVGSYAVAPLLDLSPFTPPADAPDALTNPPALVIGGSGTGTVSGAVVDCGLGAATCAGATGKICLLQRGGNIFFCDKVRACLAGGGIGALIYGRIDQDVCEQVSGATLISSGCQAPAGGAWPVVLTAARRQGELIRDWVAANPSAVLTLRTGSATSSLEIMSGTSMATPGAAAVAGLVWSAHTDCSAAELRAAISASARDAGAPGRDDEYGSGIVQALAAHQYLNANPCVGPNTDCAGAWGPWSACAPDNGVCGPGNAAATFAVTRPAAGTGAPCAAAAGATRTQRCDGPPCPRNCTGAWTTAPCDKPCGGGWAVSTYRVLSPAVAGGLPCEAADGDVKADTCNANPCPRNCTGAWTTAPCDASCGSGSAVSTYLVQSPAVAGGAPCEAANGTTRTQRCEAAPCPRNCTGAWTTGPCDASCGAGSAVSTFRVVVPAAPGGAPCEAADGAVRTDACNAAPCLVVREDAFAAVSGRWTTLSPAANDEGAIVALSAGAAKSGATLLLASGAPAGGGGGGNGSAPGAGGRAAASPGRPRDAPALTLSYLSKPGFVGQDSFTYTVTDAQGVTATARAVITVSPAPCTASACAASGRACAPATGACDCDAPGTGLALAFVANPSVAGRGATPLVAACRFPAPALAPSLASAAGVAAPANARANVSFTLGGDGACAPSAAPVAAARFRRLGTCPDPATGDAPAALPAAPWRASATPPLGAGGCAGGVYTYVVRTPSKPGCYQLRLRLADGTWLNAALHVA